MTILLTYYRLFGLVFLGKAKSSSHLERNEYDFGKCLSLAIERLVEFECNYMM